MLPKDTSLIAKKELAWIPLFGWAAFIVGTLFIDRKKGVRNDSIQEVNDHLHSGLSIIVYPEGTRSPTGEMLPFKRGAFVMAIDAQAPIVPLVLDGTRERSPKGRPSIAPGPITLWVGEPISTRGMNLKNRFSLADEVREMMVKQLEKLRENRENLWSGTSH